MNKWVASYMVLSGLLLSLGGCNTMESSGAKSLYDRLGGKPAIAAVVEDFVGRVAADSRINGKFANANIPRLKTMLTEQMCQAPGGPCTYKGRDMKSSHAGMGSIDGRPFSLRPLAIQMTVDALANLLIDGQDCNHAGRTVTGEAISYSP